jgi:hypothetical protein
MNITPARSTMCRLTRSPLMTSVIRADLFDLCDVPHTQIP